MPGLDTPTTVPSLKLRVSTWKWLEDHHFLLRWLPFSGAIFLSGEANSYIATSPYLSPKKNNATNERFQPPRHSANPSRTLALVAVQRSKDGSSRSYGAISWGEKHLPIFPEHLLEKCQKRNSVLEPLSYLFVDAGIVGCLCALHLGLGFPTYRQKQQQLNSPPFLFTNTSRQSKLRPQKKHKQTNFQNFRMFVGCFFVDFFLPFGSS